MRRATRTRTSAAILVGVAIAVGIAMAVSRSQSAGAASTPFGAVQSYLAENDYIQAAAGPAAGTVSTSAQQAEDTALARFGTPGMSGVTSTLVSATNTAYCKPQADGTCTPVISNEPVWIVLVPNQQVPIYGSASPAQSGSYTATIAVLVDALTGRYLEAAAIPST